MVLDPLSYSRDSLTGLFRQRYGKGAYHASAFFRHVHTRGTSTVRSLNEFRKNPDLADTLSRDFDLRLPRVVEIVRDVKSAKILLRYPDGTMIEIVLLFMSGYAALCVSTQVGCARRCVFCETGAMGLTRNLTAGEIVAQVMVCRFYLGIEVANLVFMGMGEPFDNWEAVMESIAVISDQRGLNIPVSAMTISTAGHVPGIKQLADHIRSGRNPRLERLSLAVSLHTVDNEQRSSLMPINRCWGLESLQTALRNYPLSHKRDSVFIEYTLFPGFNDSDNAAVELVRYLSGIPSCVNVIPCNPGPDSRFRRPERSDMDRFLKRLIEAGQACRIRDTKGDAIQAACGQLGGLVRRRSN